MTSYEYNILSQRISLLEKQMQCIAKPTVVTPPPSSCNGVVIGTQPQPVTIFTGNDATLSVVVASGDQPISYQWQKNGLSINGATAATLSITAANLSDAGNYSVVISNPCGIINSNTVGVAVSQSQTNITVYWGWTDAPITTTSEVLALQGSAQFLSGTNVTADFRANTAPKFLIMAEPLSEPAKTKWYGTDLNKGNIGTSQDLFGAPVAIGSFRVYISNYQTQQQDTPILFKII